MNAEKYQVEVKNEKTGEWSVFTRKPFDSADVAQKHLDEIIRDTLNVMAPEINVDEWFRVAKFTPPSPETTMKRLTDSYPEEGRPVILYEVYHMSTREGTPIQDVRRAQIVTLESDEGFKYWKSCENGVFFRPAEPTADLNAYWEYCPE
jgi:hypothetical protein